MNSRTRAEAIRLVKSIDKQLFKRNAHLICTAVGAAGTTLIAIGIVFILFAMYTGWMLMGVGFTCCFAFVFADRVLGFDPNPHTFEENDPGDVGRRYSF